MRCTFIFLPHIPSRSLYCSLASFHLKANLLIQPMACNFSLVTRPLSFAVPSSPLPRAVILSQSSCCLRCLLWFICICLVPEHTGMEPPSSVWLCYSPACWQRKGKTGRELGLLLHLPPATGTACPLACHQDPRNALGPRWQWQFRSHQAEHVLCPVETSGELFL